MDFSIYQQDWAAAQPEVGDFITPADGRYKVQISSAKFEISQGNDGRSTPVLQFEFEILDGDCRGSSFRKFDYVRSPRSFGFIKRDLGTLQLPVPSNLNDLPLVLTGCVGAVIDVQVKTVMANGNEYRNVYIKTLLEKPQPSEAAVQAVMQSAVQAVQMPAQPMQASRSMPGQSYPYPQAYPQGYSQPGFNDDKVPF